MSTEPLPRQTLSFLQRRFAEAGVRPKTQHGQNFLIDLNLLDILLEAANVSADDVVLEVGTGTGSLTARLAQRAAAVVTVELDPEMHQLASEELHRFENVVMLRADALKGKNRINPVVRDAVAAQLAPVNADAKTGNVPSPGRRLKLVANLPYSIATPLLSNLLAEERPPETMTATIQRELAERLTAEPGSKDYGALSIWVQSQCRVEVLRILPPEAFWPRPKVHSAFIQITLDPALRGRIPDRKFFHDFLRSMFLHRRKFLRSQLLSAAGGRLDKPAVDAVLEWLGLDGTLRAERLDVDTMLTLCEAVRPAIAS
ncbi:MAG: 16S rRNA (adenine(1518)-N(6)/adenine(1519)-N(6))-dimethyltransferase RsmA [Thermoguttaceae bacterium]